MLAVRYPFTKQGGLARTSEDMKRDAGTLGMKLALEPTAEEVSKALATDGSLPFTSPRLASLTVLWWVAQGTARYAVDLIELTEESLRDKLFWALLGKTIIMDTLEQARDRCVKYTGRTHSLRPPPPCAA